MAAMAETSTVAEAAPMPEATVGKATAMAETSVTEAAAVGKAMAAKTKSEGKRRAVAAVVTPIIWVAVIRIRGVPVIGGAVVRYDINAGSRRCVRIGRHGC